MSRVVCRRRCARLGSDPPVNNHRSEINGILSTDNDLVYADELICKMPEGSAHRANKNDSPYHGALSHSLRSSLPCVIPYQI